MFGLPIFVIFAVTATNAGFHKYDCTQRHFTYDSNGFHNGHVVHHNHHFGSQPNFDGPPHHHYPSFPNYGSFGPVSWPTISHWPPQSPIFPPFNNIPNIPSVNSGKPTFNTFPFNSDPINSVPFPNPSQPNFGPFGTGTSTRPTSNMPYNPQTGFFNPFLIPNVPNTQNGAGFDQTNSGNNPSTVVPPNSVGPNQSNGGAPPNTQQNNNGSPVNNPVNIPSNLPDNTTPINSNIDPSIDENPLFDNENGVQSSTEHIGVAGNQPISTEATNDNESGLNEYGFGENSSSNDNDSSNSRTEPIVKPPTSNVSPLSSDKDDELIYDIDVRLGPNDKSPNRKP